MVHLISRDDITFTPAEVAHWLSRGALLISSAGRTVLVPRLAGGRGPNTDEIKKTAQDQKAMVGPQVDWSNWQKATAQDWMKGSAEKYGQAGYMLANPMSFWSGLASGDRSKMNAVAAPALTNLANQYRSARETAILQPRGVAQDYFLQQLPMQQAGQTAQQLNQAYILGQDKSTELGKLLADWGLQMGAGAMRSAEGGAQTYKSAADIMSNAGQTQAQAAQAEAAKKAATMGFLGDTVGAVAGPFSKAFGVK